jgi:hypothetical protein
MAIAAATSTQVSIPDQAFWKITLRLMPYLALLWCLAWIDRVNIGFAKLTMLDDLKFSEAVYGLGAGMFFLGYFFFEVPSNLLLQKIWSTQNPDADHDRLGGHLHGYEPRRDANSILRAAFLAWSI